MSELPVRIIVPLQKEVLTTEGATVVLVAEVSKPNVPVAWFKDDLEILPKVDKKYNIMVNETIHTLEIHDISLEDNAEYTLEVGEESTMAVVKVEGSLMNFLDSLNK